MATESRRQQKVDTTPRELSKLFMPLSSALLGVAEPERYRVLASFLSNLAEQSDAAADGRQGASGEHIEGLARQAQALAKDKATLEDRLRTTAADLAVAQKQLDAEKARAAELEGAIDDQRKRLQAAEQELEQLQAQVVALNASNHKAEIRCEELELRAQRAELALGDRSQVDGLEESRRDLAAQAEALRAQLDQLRVDKDAEIKRIGEELAKVKSGAAGSSDATLAGLWQRMASAKPPLAEENTQPDKQAAQRLIDAFVVLVRFVDEFDKSMRVFLNQYCQHHPSVKAPWEAYARGDGLYEFARRTVATKGGRPVKPLEMRLQFLYNWTYAGMVGCDAAFASVRSELQSHLLGPAGAGSDPKCPISDYLRNSGPELFMQHMNELRSLKIAEAFGRG
ncbi:MAG: hypothetical protein ACE5HE_13635 [Phycisphaerae bacterium]